MSDSFVFYKSFYDAISELDPDSQLETYQAICSYAITGEEPELSGVASAMFKLMKPQIDANIKRRENGKKGAEYGKMGGRKPQENPKETPSEPQENPKETPNVNANANINENVKEKVSPSGDTKKKSAKRFTPPTVEEVREYASQRGYSAFSAERFVDFYKSKGWMIGKNKMEDWKASVRSWNARDQETSGAGSRAAPTKFSNFEERSSTDLDAIELAMIRKSMEEPLEDLIEL